MNRIEEIKERLVYFPTEFRDNSLAFEARLDIEYLLSKLQTAEKALESIAESEMGSTNYPHVQTAKEALQQIRS